MVVAVAVTVAADPAVLRIVGVQMPERVGQAMRVIYYGLALLRSRLVRGALIATSAAALAAIEGRLPGGPGLRLIRLSPAFTPRLQILAGIFARKGERDLYSREHPLNLLWNAFQVHAQEASAARQGDD